jgi:hypothetical protein
MKVADVLSILNDEEKEEAYKILKKDHEKRIEEESKRSETIIKIKDYDFKYYLNGVDNSTIGYIDIKVFEIDEILDWFHRHKYSDNLTVIPSGNPKSVKYILDIFRNMNYKVKNSRSYSEIKLEKRK